MPRTDREDNLIKSLINGHIASFEAVFKEYNRKIFLFSLKFLKNKEDAEGVVQDVFFSFWQNRERMKEDSNLNAYLFTIAFNSIRKRFRKLNREKKHLDKYSLMMNGTDKELTQNESFDLTKKVDHIIDKLPLQQKKVILLKKDKDYSISEIAEELNLAKKTVGNHLHRARNLIRNAMKKEGLLGLLFFILFID